MISHCIERAKKNVLYKTSRKSLPFSHSYKCYSCGFVCPAALHKFLATRAAPCSALGPDGALQHENTDLIPCTFPGHALAPSSVLVGNQELLNAEAHVKNSSSPKNALEMGFICRFWSFLFLWALRYYF